MKFIWTPEDITTGRIVCKPSSRDPFEPCGWTAKWTLKIGWLSAGNPARPYSIPRDLDRKERRAYLEANRADYCLIAMTDGMVYSPKTKIELAQQLTEDEMIPMPQLWFIKTMRYLKNLNEQGNWL